MVSANIKPDQTLAAKLSGYYEPYKIINVGSEKVAVVGYTTAETPYLSMPGRNIYCCMQHHSESKLCHNTVADKATFASMRSKTLFLSLFCVRPAP